METWMSDARKANMECGGVSRRHHLIACRQRSCIGQQAKVLSSVNRRSAQSRGADLPNPFEHQPAASRTTCFSSKRSNLRHSRSSSLRCSWTCDEKCRSVGEDLRSSLVASRCRVAAASG
jgi:hypothetical protein